MIILALPAGIAGAVILDVEPDSAASADHRALRHRRAAQELMAASGLPPAFCKP
jgi:hypothetical protein